MSFQFRIGICAYSSLATDTQMWPEVVKTTALHIKKTTRELQSLRVRVVEAIVTCGFTENLYDVNLAL